MKGGGCCAAYEQLRNLGMPKNDNYLTATCACTAASASAATASSASNAGRAFQEEFLKGLFWLLLPPLHHLRHRRWMMNAFDKKRHLYL